MPKLDRTRWHAPLVSVVVTHFNYSDHVEDALLSLLDQSHQNWECVVVDDASAPEHHERLNAIVSELACHKIRVVQNERNLGQIPSFYVGVDNSSGDFVALLDPDDRYAETFLQEAVAAHLDDTFMCPQVSADQYCVTEHGLTAATYMGHLALRRAAFETANLRAFVKNAAAPDRIFFPPWWNDWLWSSTSAILFRRPALKYLRPHRPLAYRRAADSYLASGAHMLGGTLFLPKPLVYRRVHSRNGFLTADLFSMDQSKQRAGAEQWYLTCRRDVVEAMFHNGVADIFDAAFLSTILKIHFSADDLDLLRATSAGVATLPLSLAKAPPSAPEPASAPGLARESALARGWRRLRKSGAWRWAAAPE
ncbi:MAG TPA: glycosyltransferase family 2 protein [Hyphomicrobiaceae bacterium]|jgi:glycosyltransferase involved in cell wall biosynthesis